MKIIFRPLEHILITKDLEEEDDDLTDLAASLS